MAKSTRVDVDSGASNAEPKGRENTWNSAIDELRNRFENHWQGDNAWSGIGDAVKGGVRGFAQWMSALRWKLNARVQRLYDRYERLGALDATFRKGVLNFGEKAAKAYADMSWARVALLTIMLMAIIGTADHLIGRPVSFRLIYMLPIWVATRLGGGGSGFVAMLIAGVFCTIGDTPFEISRAESQTLNFAVRWLSLGGFLLIVLQVEGALKLARQRATRDPLTGLANRFTIETMAEEAIGTSGSKADPIHLAVIDCDNFKSLNDANGHAFGDHALKMLGKRLESEVHPFGSVARLGGDEFIVLFKGADREQAILALQNADAGFRKILESLESTGGISFGLATSGEDGSTYAALYRVADERMYAKKRARREGVACVQLSQPVLLRNAC